MSHPLTTIGQPSKSCDRLFWKITQHNPLHGNEMQQHRRLTSLHPVLRNHSAVTASLSLAPHSLRRPFSVTPARPATPTHYDTLSISRNASKGQIKVSSSPPHSKAVCASCVHAPFSPPSTRYVLPNSVFWDTHDTMI